MKERKAIMIIREIDDEGKAIYETAYTSFIATGIMREQKEGGNVTQILMQVSPVEVAAAASHMMDTLDGITTEECDGDCENCKEKKEVDDSEIKADLKTVISALAAAFENKGGKKDE